MNIHTSQHIAQAYECNGSAVDAATFTAAACNPHQSVVVEACAGSGKTWLLVARMLRLLLEGAEPAELLAITFTRKAAQEMRHRLMQLLEELALADEDKARVILRERGVAEHQMAIYLPRARNLYQELLSKPQGLSMDTFHSWFARLLQLAPLASGVPHGFSLVEASSYLQQEAYGQFMQMLGKQNDDEGIGGTSVKDIKDKLLFLYQELGDSSTQNMLNAFVDKRAEWWAASANPAEFDPLKNLRDMLGEDAIVDARTQVWHDSGLIDRISQVARCLGQGSKINQTRAIAIESAVTAAQQVIRETGQADSTYFATLAYEFYSPDCVNRKNRRTKDLAKAVAAWLGQGNDDAFDDECNAIAETLKVFERRSKEISVLRINEALFTVGTAYVNCYQELKSAQGLLDFSDLEWHAYRLLQQDEFAAYLHGRLDARYKHILLDEFQDTNPLQWHIVSAWLDAYGADTSRPTVFIVGDPKQSIYRFRRADPRVFEAAREMLAAQGAAVLRTNQTRRNATAIIDVLNQAMVGNGMYSPQTTASNSQGSVLRLPLIREKLSLDIEDAKVDAENAATEDSAQPTSDSASPFPLRDPFTTPDEEQEDLARYQEGKCVGQMLLALQSQAHASGNPWAWSEVMLLVRRRTHLSSYERALRELRIPFVSNRRGGLLNTLEIIDLIALLNFLMAPGDNRSLAHVLKSPIFGASDEELIDLAQSAGSSWWKRLLNLVSQRSETNVPNLHRAVVMLRTWMQAAHDLPVHDLIDMVLHQGELVQRYAQVAPASNREQVIGNITAFTELALNLDGGRYPSLPKFIAALKEYDKGAETESPDESNVSGNLDALRILTIHSAKGLEANIVVMLDSNHSEAAKDHVGILCAWPLRPGEQKHFSVFGRSADRGMKRDPLFLAEAEQAAQENWNLLYVAVTRAKQMLVVSGIAHQRGDETGESEGVAAQSWYQRFAHLPETEMVNASQTLQTLESTEFSLSTFNPPNLALPPADMSEPSSPEQIEGIALHALMERLTNDVKSWPIRVPNAEVIAAWLPCAPQVAQVVAAQASKILQIAELERYFDPRQFQFARNEMDIVFEQQVLRLDRLVAFGEEVWILDYKRQFLDSEKEAYRQQVRQYREAVQAIYPQKQIQLGLILADASLIRIE